MWCVLSAVRDCHGLGVALLDVKPHNMLLAGEGHVRQLRLDQLDEASPPVVACDFGWVGAGVQRGDGREGGALLCCRVGGGGSRDEKQQAIG